MSSWQVGNKKLVWEVVNDDGYLIGAERKN
jgi:hypothetical protein